jgi:YidC/Oxa1 family membrane protein insertase
MKEFFHSVLYQPIYNAFVYLIDILPGSNAGWAIIILIILIRIVLYPISQKTIINQMKMQAIQAPLKEIQEKYKNEREKMTLAMMELYKQHKLNPFLSIFLLFIQIPILFALYYVFYKSGLPNINVSDVYSFVKIPEVVGMIWLGFNLAQKSLILALFAALTQFIYGWFVKKTSSSTNLQKNTFSHDLNKAMHFQIIFIIPIIIFFISYKFASVLALYFIISNITLIIQQWYLSKHTKSFLETKN